MIRLLLVIFVCSSINTYSQGYLCAIGGGSENYNDWSDAPYGWIVDKSDSGKIIIISDSDASSWLPTYFLSLGASIAINKKIDSRATADLQSTYEELVTASAIFIRGGDQWDYIHLWKGTKTEEAIVYVYQNGGVIAGTSAGAAVLGDMDFTAKYGSAYPRSSLTNPLQTKLDFEDEFLDLQPNVIFDSHFVERGRFGRLIPMVYKIYNMLGKDLIGVGVDDKTALCIDPDGIAEVMGSAAVAFYYRDEMTNYTDFINNLYTVENLKCDQLTKGWKFNLNSREIDYIPPTGKVVDTSRTWQFPVTSLTLTGSNNIANQLDGSFINFLSEINSPEVVVFSNQNFSSNAQTIIDFLNQQSIGNNLLILNQSSLNNPEYEQKVNSANVFVFTGDSLSVLSLLNQTSESVPQAFYNKVISLVPCFFFGNSGKVAGEYYIDNTDTEGYAAYRGKLTNNEGIDLFGEMIFQPVVFDDADFYENRTCSVLWGMMLNRSRIGIYLDGETSLKIDAVTNSISGSGTVPGILVDARNTTYIDSSTYIAGSGIAPRQVVAMNNLRISLTKYSEIKYLLEEGRFDNLVNVEKKTDEFSHELKLEQNYPNPFNPETTIEFSIPEGGNISILIFDSLGEKVSELANGYYNRGTHKIFFNGSSISSGIYFYRLETGNFSLTKPMILLK